MRSIGALLGLGVFALTSVVHALDVTSMAIKLKPSVTHVTILDSAGNEFGSASGFFITSTGWMATNHHVIDNAAGLKVRTPDGAEHRAIGILAQDENNDLAIVQIEGSNFPAVDLVDMSNVVVGEEIVNIGSPGGLDFSVSEGRVAAIRPQGLPDRFSSDKLKNTPIIQVTALSGRGSSGSPVFNASGKVIGVIESGTTDGVGRFAVAADALKALQATVTPTTKPQPFSSERSVGKNLMFSAIFFGAIAFVGVSMQGFSRWREKRRTALRKRLAELKSELT